MGESPLLPRGGREEETKPLLMETWHAHQGINSNKRLMGHRPYNTTSHPPFPSLTPSLSPIAHFLSLSNSTHCCWLVQASQSLPIPHSLYSSSLPSLSWMQVVRKQKDVSPATLHKTLWKCRCNIWEYVDTLRNVSLRWETRKCWICLANHHDYLSFEASRTGEHQWCGWCSA